MQINQWILCYFYIVFKESWNCIWAKSWKWLLRSSAQPRGNTVIYQCSSYNIARSAHNFYQSTSGFRFCGETAKKWYALKPHWKKGCSDQSVGICSFSAFALDFQKGIFESCRWLWKVEGRRWWESWQFPWLWTLVGTCDRGRASQRSCKWVCWTAQGRWPWPAVLPTPAHNAIWAQIHL